MESLLQSATANTSARRTPLAMAAEVDTPLTEWTGKHLHPLLPVSVYLKPSEQSSGRLPVSGVLHAI